MATIGGLVVATENEQQAVAWNADEGQHWAAHHEFYDRAVRHHHEHLMAAMMVGRGERVLDVGCGNGQVTRDAARACEPGAALGIDLSAPMIERARAIAAAEGLDNVSFVQGDVQIHAFEERSFDVAVSRFGAMFFGDQVAAFTNVRRALRANGRLVLVSWQAPAANEWITTIVDALTMGRAQEGPAPAGAPGPFGHANPRDVETILASAGFRDVHIAGIEEPVYLGRDAAEGFEVLSVALRWMTEGLDDAERSEALARLRAALVDQQTPDGIALGSAAWLITAVVA